MCTRRLEADTRSQLHSAYNLYNIFNFIHPLELRLVGQVIFFKGKLRAYTGHREYEGRDRFI